MVKIVELELERLIERLAIAGKILEENSLDEVYGKATLITPQLLIQRS